MWLFCRLWHPMYCPARYADVCGLSLEGKWESYLQINLTHKDATTLGPIKCSLCWNSSVHHCSLVGCVYVNTYMLCLCCVYIYTSMWALWCMDSCAVQQIMLPTHPHPHPHMHCAPVLTCMHTHTALFTQLFV